jgi:hypothetical protein
MSRYSARSATSGNVILNSSRKGGNTLSCWFYINLGRASCGRDKWVEFDVREVATQLGVALPQFMTSEELQQCRGNPDGFEILLCRDLQRVADWCSEHNAVAVITKAGA